MPLLTAIAQPPDDPFSHLDKLTDDEPDAWNPVRRHLNDIQANMVEIRRRLLMMEIESDYRRMYPPVCVPNRRHL
jgi:hypothetical protein